MHCSSPGTHRVPSSSHGPPDGISSSTVPSQSSSKLLHISGTGVWSELHSRTPPTHSVTPTPQSELQSAPPVSSSTSPSQSASSRSQASSVGPTSPRQGPNWPEPSDGHTRMPGWQTPSDGGPLFGSSTHCSAKPSMLPSQSLSSPSHSSASGPTASHPSHWPATHC